MPRASQTPKRGAKRNRSASVEGQPSEKMPATTAASNGAALRDIRSSSPLKPALKTHRTSSSPRKHHLASDESPERASTKRPRVEFDPSPMVHDVKPRVAVQIREEVDKTLQRAAKGDLEEYNMLKRHFQNDNEQRSRRDPTIYEPLQPNELGDYILALASLSSKLKEKRYRDLVKVVLDINWVGRDDAFVHGFIEFLASLASFGDYLSDCVDMIFDWFYDSRPRTWTVPGYLEVDRAVAEERLHRAIKRLCQVSAATSKTILNLARVKYPNHDDNRRVHRTYVSHLLNIREYVPQIRQELLDVIVDKVVSMDASMLEDLDDLDSEVAQAVTRAIRIEMAPGGQDDNSDSDTDTDDDEDDDEDEGHERLQLIKKVKNAVNVLDSMMEMFAKFHGRHFEKPESDEAEAGFELLLSQFSRFLLPTRRSRHFQFLVFQFAQRSEKLMNRFIRCCERHAFLGKPSQEADVAVAYLGSFIARGANVPPHMVQHVFNRLLARLEERRKSHEGRCLGPNKEKYHGYYALFQAAIYIFCFRWQSLILSTPPDVVDPEDPLSYINQDLEWDEKARLILSSNAQSRLNPLKVCSQVIVEEFATMAWRLNFIYVIPILELNKRVRLSQYLQGSYSAGGGLRDARSDIREDEDLQLDAWFPFDPYQLPRTKAYFLTNFLHWSVVPGLHAQAEESDGYESDEEDDDMAEDAVADGTETDMDDDEV